VSKSSNSKRSNRNTRKPATTAAPATEATQAAPVVAEAPAAPVAPEQPAAALPVTSKPVQVAVGLKIEKDRPEQNGVKRPSAGGRCRAVWDACDEMVAAGDTPTASDIRAIAEANGWNANNASIEFYQWRKFNGITGRQAKPKAPAAEPAKQDS
jgi:hypothetical protein